MFLPVGDTPNPSKAAWITWALMALNIGVFLLVSLPLMTAAPDTTDPLYTTFIEVMSRRGVDMQQLRQQVSAYDLFVFRYGFRPADASLVTLFSSLFLHASWFHLIGNMIYLWIFGNNVEARLGHIGFLGAYLASGVVATLFFSFFVPGSQVPMLGASGAISGVLGCYFVWFPRNQVKVFIFLFPIIMDVVLIPAPLVLGLYLLVDNLLPFLVNAGGGSGVAHGAHIGGFLGGLLIAVIFHGRAPRGGRG
ncbi:MAG: rhomboid family intramembrane serine protease [Desulfuromonadales bacterium]